MISTTHTATEHLPVVILSTVSIVPTFTPDPKDSPLNGKLVMIHGTDVMDSTMIGSGSTTIDGEVS